MKRMVAIYARVSTEHEAQLSALDNQIQYYDEILKQHPDWHLYKRYVDEGITGTSIKKRPNFLQMIEDAKNGCFSLIITREVSRFARNTVDTLQTVRELKKYAVEVYFTEDNIMTFNDEDGELKLTIMATLAQNESKKISQRVKAGQLISFQNGVLYGTGNILGYDKVGKEMVINEEQAKTVKFIYESYLKGLGTSAIKYELEKRGMLTATGLSRWNVATITRILKNPFYCGTIVYRKEFVPDYLEQKRQKNNGEVSAIVVEGKHEKLVSKEDFEKVQAIIKNNATHLKANNRVYHGIAKNVWSKLLICNCGSSFNRRTYHRYGDYNSYCYECYNVKNNGSTKRRLEKNLDTTGSCNMTVIAEWKLNIIANKVFSILCNDKNNVIRIASELLERNINDSNNEDELNELSNKLTREKRKIDNLLDLYLNESLTKEKYLEKRTEFDLSISKIKAKINLLSGNENDRQRLKNKINELKEILNKSLIDENGCVSDALISRFIQWVKVKDNKFVVKVNNGVESNDDTPLTTIDIAKKDVLEFEKNHKYYKKLRLKEPIIVDVII